MQAATEDAGIVMVDGLPWLRQKGAAERLGVDPKTIQRLADDGLLRTMDSGGERGRLYLVASIDRVKTHGVEIGGITLYRGDGRLSLSRPMKPVPAECLVERLDYCWATLKHYGLIRDEVAEKIRCNLAYAVMKASRRDRSMFQCLQPDQMPPEGDQA